MERDRGIDGDRRIGHGPAIGGLLRTLAAAAALSVAGTLEAQEQPARAAPSPAVERYAKERHRTLSEIRTILERVDGNEFAEREVATREFDEAAYRLRAKEPRVGQDARDIITGKLSAEQRSRVGSIVENVTAFNFTPSKLSLHGTVRCDEALRLWSKHMNVTLVPGDEKIAQRMLQTIEIRPDMTYAQTIAAVCAATDTLPAAEARAVRFVQRPGEAAVTASPWAVGITRSHDDGSRTLQAMAEPGFATIVRLCHSIDVGTYGWKNGDTVLVEGKGPPATWMVAGMLLEPRAVRLPANGNTEAGFQEIVTTTRRMPEGWKTVVTVTSNLPREPKEDEPKRPKMYGDPPAPKDLSMETVCSSNRFAILNDYGTAVQPARTASKPLVNGMEYEFDTAQRPVSVDANVWTVYREELIAMPVTPPAPTPLPSDPGAK